jgi:hypothetical protein
VLITTFTLAVSVPAQVDWTPSPAIPNREHHAAAFDTARGRLVVFGGYNAAEWLGDTWEFDGRGWSRRTTATSPSPSARRGATMVYDPVRQRCVLFGGQRRDSLLLDDTWEWDGFSWLRRHPTTSPPPRLGHAATYDSVRRRVLLYGGLGSSSSYSPLSDTWTWDGTNWTQVALTSSAGAWAFHALAFDPTRGRAVLLGHCVGCPVSAAPETWEWDGATWTRQSPSVLPASQLSQTLAFDPTSARVVLYDWVGYALYRWDGVNWSALRMPRDNPGPRIRSTLLFDTVRQQLVLFGGWGRNGTMSDVWHWDGTAWSLTWAGTPSARTAAAIAHDPTRNRAVLFGGALSTGGGAPRGDLWEWDGQGWTPARVTFTNADRSHHALAFDPVRQRVVMFGGRGPGNVDRGDMQWWSWQDHTLRGVAPAGPAPSARHAHAMVTDTARSRIVLFGGRSGQIDLADTWEWDGTGWTDRAPATAPQPIFGHAMAYDAARERTVLFGGANARQTWEWDGGQWVQRIPLTLPPPRTGHAMAYDGARQRVVMFGGVGASNAQLADVWEWDGADWRARTTATSPRARARHVMWFDPLREAVLTHGGVEIVGQGAYSFADVWSYGATHRSVIDSFGAGCRAGGGAPVLTTLAGQRPWSGDSLAVQMRGLTAGHLAVLCVGSSRMSWPGSPNRQLPVDLTPLGALGCSLLVSPDVLLSLANPSGVGTVALPVPADPRLLGARFVMQGFSAEGSTNPLPLVASNGLEGTIGTR